MQIGIFKIETDIMFFSRLGVSMMKMIFKFVFPACSDD